MGKVINKEEYQRIFRAFRKGDPVNIFTSLDVIIEKIEAETFTNFAIIAISFREREGIRQTINFVACGYDESWNIIDVKKDKNILSLDNYQKLANEVAIYPGRKSLQGLIYCVLGLNGEAGEVAEKIKKQIRDKGSKIDEQFKDIIIKELGDVLWYISQICSELDIDLSHVAKTNIDKLFDRRDRNKLNGSGDNR